MSEKGVIGFSRDEDWEDTKASVRDFKRKDHRVPSGPKHVPAPPNIRWGKVVTAWSSSTPNAITVRPCFADGTADPHIKTNGDHDKTLYIVWPPEADPGDMTLILPADTLVPWVPFGVVLDEAFEGLLLMDQDRRVAVSPNDTKPGFLRKGSGTQAHDKIVGDNEADIDGGSDGDGWLEVTELKDAENEQAKIEHKDISNHANRTQLVPVMALNLGSHLPGVVELKIDAAGHVLGSTTTTTTTTTTSTTTTSTTSTSTTSTTTTSTTTTSTTSTTTTSTTSTTTTTTSTTTTSTTSTSTTSTTTTPAPCPSDCTACPDSLTVVVSGLTGTCPGGTLCPNLNGTYVLTKTGASCLWLAANPGGSTPPLASGAALRCVGQTWEFYSNVFACYKFTAPNVSGCPPIGAWTWVVYGGCGAGTATVSET